jgi:ankyrin repeat protein
MSSANDRLVDAADRGDVPEIERQLAAGADPNAFEGTDNWTPLQMAADGGRLAVVVALLKAGAHVDGAKSDGWTPLMFATDNGHTATIDALLAAGADVQHTDSHGNAVLHRASVHGQLNAARMVLQAGARTEVRNGEGKRPVDLVRAPLARWKRLRDCLTPLYRRTAMRRCAHTPRAVSTSPPCARCSHPQPPGPAAAPWPWPATGCGGSRMR